jgi:hypothetical protein
VSPVTPAPLKSSCTTTKVPLNGTTWEKNTVALLIFTRETVTGATATSIILTPTTSPVFIGEAPSKKSPWEEDNAKAVPFVDWDDCVASHQSNTYLPASRKVITPVAGL